jgi:hypothetical protein
MNKKSDVYSNNARDLFNWLCSQFGQWPTDDRKYLEFIQRALANCHESKTKELRVRIKGLMDELDQKNKTIDNFDTSQKKLMRENDLLGEVIRDIAEKVKVSKGDCED